MTIPAIISDVQGFAATAGSSLDNLGCYKLAADFYGFERVLCYGIL